MAPHYDAMLCDAWGVIHNGAELFDGAAHALTRFRSERGPVVILTNAPRPSSIIPAQLDRLGLPREAYDAVVTSGDATRAEIEKFLPAPAHRIGPVKDDPLFEGLEIRFAPPESAEFIICTGLVNDQSEQPEDYRDHLTELAARKLPMICANPDIIVNWGGRKIWCAGALAQIYEELGGGVIYGGKPFPPIYRLALARIAEAKGAAVPPERVLVIGDGLKTDIAGANRAGMNAIFVTGAGGIHDGPNTPDAIGNVLRDNDVKAIAVMEALNW